MFKETAKKRSFSFIVLSFLLITGSFVFEDSAWLGDKNLHTIMESLASLLSLVVGLLAFVRYYSHKELTILFVATAFVGTAFLDGYHAVITSSYFDLFLPSTSSSLSAWSWYASRFFLSVMMILSWLAWFLEKKKRNPVTEITVYVFVFLFTLAIFLFFIFVSLPRAYYPELILGRPQELLIGFFFAIALFGYLKKNQWQSNSFDYWLILFLIVSFLSEIFFIPRSFHLFDFMFDGGHLLKQISYILVLIGLMINIYQLFHDNEAFRLEIEQTNKDLTRSNQELEQFAYVASHDLQEPLRKITSFAEILSEELEGKLDSQTQDYFTFMSDAAKRMRNLIKDLLDFSRSGSRELVKGAVDLNMIMDRVKDNLELNITEKQAQLSYQNLPTVFCSPNFITQVFQNLITNGVKFTEPNQKPEIKISSIKRDDDWEIRVEDNGIGIDPDYHHKVFEIFKRLHRKDKFSGTGIGLAICKRIIERHGGKIWIEPALPHGTIFCFTLPKA